MDVRTEAVMQTIFDGEDSVIAPASWKKVSGYSDIFIDDECIARGVPTSRVHAQLAFFRDFFAGAKISVIENESYGVNDEPVFAGNPAKFSHVSSHVLSHVPMFDIMDNRGIVIHRNLSMEAAMSILANDATLHPIRRNVSRTGAPQPTVTTTGGVDSWRHREPKKVGKEKVYRSIETRTSGAPRDCNPNTFIVLSRKNNERLHEGSKHSARQYVEQYIKRRGQYLRDIKVVRKTTIERYLASCDTRVRYNGKVICVAPLAEAREFVADAIKRKHVNPQHVSAEKIS